MDAAKWYGKAARQDNPNAQYLLGLFYKEGSGVAKDPAESYKWMQLAAEQGNPDHIEARKHLALLLTPDIVAEGQRRAEQFHIYELAAKNKAAAEDTQSKQISSPSQKGQASNN
jgi:TPR repeat protein